MNVILKFEFEQLTCDVYLVYARFQHVEPIDHWNKLYEAQKQRNITKGG